MSRRHQLLATLELLLWNSASKQDQMGYPVPEGYGTAAGSHVWQGRGVHAERAHMEASCPLVNRTYRSAGFLQFHLMTIFFSLMQLLFLVPHLLS